MASNTPRTPDDARPTPLPQSANTRREPSDDFERPDPLSPRADQPQELSFDDDDSRDGRVGDLRSREEVEREFPLRREAQAGMTAGEYDPGRSATADDLTPETLLDEDGARGEFGDDPEQMPADKTLRTVGSAEIGGGIGLDEEEMAHVERPDRVLPDKGEHH